MHIVKHFPKQIHQALLPIIWPINDVHMADFSQTTSKETVVEEAHKNTGAKEKQTHYSSVQNDAITGNHNYTTANFLIVNLVSFPRYHSNLICRKDCVRGRWTGWVTLVVENWGSRRVEGMKVEKRARNCFRFDIAGHIVWHLGDARDEGAGRCETFEIVRMRVGMYEIPDSRNDLINVSTTCFLIVCTVAHFDTRLLFSFFFPFVVFSFTLPTSIQYTGVACPTNLIRPCTFMYRRYIISPVLRRLITQRYCLSCDIEERVIHYLITNIWNIFWNDSFVHVHSRLDT